MADGSPIQAEVDAPTEIHLKPRAATVRIDVLAKIHNTGDHDYVLGAANPDDVHNWHVLDENHREVTRPAAKRAAGRAYGGARKKVHPHTTQTVAAGHSHHAPQTLKLDAKKLKPGKTYTIRYEFWGNTAETRFTVVPGHTSPPRKAAKKKTTRKAAAKKAPRKAAKKTAKKTATKKTAKKK